MVPPLWRLPGIFYYAMKIRTDIDREVFFFKFMIMFV